MLTATVRVGCLSMALLAASAPVARSAWPHSPFVNLPVCTAPNPQINPRIVEDGTGGAIVVWQDNRTPANDYDIYCQHILRAGTVDPAWPVNGRLLCGAPGAQTNPVVSSDGAGGALVAWSDGRVAASDIYAGHVRASGVVDPLWPVDGLAVCTATGAQSSPAIIPDGLSGALLVWTDARAGNTDVYAQHVLGSGTVDGAWPVNGRGVVTEGDPQSAPALCSDGAGGAIVSWVDGRGVPLTYIFAGHVQSSGALDPLWPVQGQQVSDIFGGVQTPALVPDGAAGAIITWAQYSTGTSTYDVHLQHLLSTGVADSNWPVGGSLSAGSGVGDQLAPAIVSDGAGGAVVAWHDARNVNDGANYAEHVTNNGEPDAAWPPGGLRVGGLIGGDVQPPVLTGDGAGGIVAAWQRGSIDLYARAVQVTGVVDATWPGDGQPLCQATLVQSSPVIASDGDGGAIVAWVDPRGGTSDIYAQRIARFGYLGTPEAVISSVLDVSGDQGGSVKLSWDGSYLDADSDPNLSTYEIYRSVGASTAMAALARGVPIARGLAQRPTSAGALVSTIEHGDAYYWEFIEAQAPLHYLTHYSGLYATGGDSTASGAPWTAFMVVARNAAGTLYWLSAPDSGYSVDNLAPSAPQSFTGTYASGTSTLRWLANPEPDLAGYRLYRGATAGFSPGPSSLVAALSGTGYADPAGGPAYYRLTAIDVHGNESPSVLLLPDGTAGVPVVTEAALALAPPAPNPAGSAVQLAVTLPAAGSAQLAIFDASGRRVRILLQGAQPAGTLRIVWDCRNEAGQPVPGGVYWARLAIGGRELERRVVVL